MFSRIIYHVVLFFRKNPNVFWWTISGGVLGLIILFVSVKIYQNFDQDSDRGAIAINDGAFGESYSTPVYLDQGWDEGDSLWFYNTTQGSALLPYDFFLVLEQADSQEKVRSNKNIDKFRYLPQKDTFSNPDGLPVGFVKETYQGKDYMGFTCATCHTSQINFDGKAIRIDGGPAMANMPMFLKDLEKAMISAQKSEKNGRFVEAVIDLDNDYSTADEVNADLKKWTDSISLYNIINHSHIKYGYARLDAFGRIYNRVLEHVLNKKQVDGLFALITTATGRRLLTEEQIDKVLEGVNETIIGDEQFSLILKRLQSKDAGFPGLNFRQILQVRNALFNEPNAPVSYPFLWDIAQSTYVQWNGIADNSSVGPLGRNAGEVVGVFGILDWEATDPIFSLSAYASGQKNKTKKVSFKSSIDLINLQRLESHLRTLQSPLWPEKILGDIDRDKADRGELIYAKHCQSCHELIDRSDWDRLVVANMSSLENVGTDIAMATNSVTYKGKSGNFKHTYQKVSVGDVVLMEDAPVAQILTSVVTGVVATPDADKWFIRRWVDWVYVLVMSFADNNIEPSVKSGNYNPDTTAQPYNSLLAYKARSLNGIWATAPYLHNGSVPTLYDLLLPAKGENDPEEGEYRPSEFIVGSREFNPEKVGFRYEGYEGSKFTTFRVGDMNIGHEYGTRTDGQPGTTLTADQRWDLIEYLKTL